MTLSELYEAKFRGDVRFRGEAYLKAERVAITRITEDAVHGLVRDGVEYRTQLTRVGDQLKLFCECSAGNPNEPTCKHLWATLRTVDESRLLTAAPRPGFVPPFVAERPKFVSTEIDWDEDEDGDELRLPGPSRRPPRPAVEPRRELRPWEQGLLAIRDRITGGEPAAAATGREQEVFYEIDLAQSAEVGQLVVQASQRQRRANGQWGKLKPLKLRADRLNDVEAEEDRRVLAYLFGGIPERTNWYAQQAESQSLVHRFRVQFELAELLLPMMCATGRVRYVDEKERMRDGLTWDEGPPFELTVRVVAADDATGWRLESVLLRGEERLAQEDVLALVPGGLVLRPHGISRLNDFDAFEWTKLVRDPQAIRIAPGEEHEFVERLLDMPVLPRLELPQELQLEQVECEPLPRLMVKTPRTARWHFERLQGEVSFDYLGSIIGGSNLQWAVVQREAGRCVLRNRTAEDRAWTQLQTHGFRRLHDRRRGCDVEIGARELGPAVRALIAAGWQIHADGKQVRQPAEMKLRVASNIDWFELRADVDFEGHSVSFPELLSALGRGDGTIRLDDGSLGILPEEWIERYGLLAGLGVADGDSVRFARNQLALLDALLASQPSVDYDERFLELRRDLESFAGVKGAEEPAGFAGELRGYQREGLGWLEFLQKFQFGGCLADDMGLGKTVQFLALLLHRCRTRGKKLPSLVVVPKSLLFNWCQEAERFTPELKVMQYTGLDRAPQRREFARHDLVVTTYGTLRRDVLLLKDVAFDYVVLDEAQTIKNAGSQVAKAARLLQAENRVALSGTPIENHLGDLWSIFEFLNPGMLGRSSVFKLYASDAADVESRQLLSKGLRPFILRRTKQQVASELPEKVEQTIFCDMRKDQQRLYLELRDHYRDSLLGLIDKQGLSKSKMHVLEALLRLRQAACHPALLDKSSDEESSAKLDVLCPHLEELIDEGHKALVFSQFTSMLAIVRKHLDRRGIVYEYLDGQTRDRKQRVERFQADPACSAFLISLKAGGLGLNLTAADYVFLLDPWWNPAVEAQAIDRAHRVGQTRQVMAYRLICRGTVEEKIAELQGKKRALADAILEADGSMLENLSTEDIEMLLS